MPLVICNHEELRRQRSEDIRRRLDQVSDGRVYVAPQPTSNDYFLTANYGQQVTSRRRDWSFPSIVDAIRCKYGEHWISVDSTDQEFRLRSVYFQLLQHRGADENPKEIIAFHWHPMNLPEESEYGFKDRPHLHLQAAPDPLPKSHLGVALAVSTDNQGTVQYLDRLLDETIEMISAEVLDRLEASPLAL